MKQRLTLRAQEFVFHTHNFWFSISTNTKNDISFCRGKSGVFNSVCEQVRLCVCKRVYSTDRPPQASLFRLLSNNRRVCVDDLLSVELITAALPKRTHTHTHTLSIITATHRLCENIKG